MKKFEFKIMSSIKNNNHSEFEKIISTERPYNIGEKVIQKIIKKACKKNK
jgi:hypothetical protein